MAKFVMELPTELYNDFNTLLNNCPELFEKMTRAGAEVVYRQILNNMRYAFSDTTNLAPHLQITKSYRTAMGKFVNTKVAFYGYYRKNDRDYIQHRKSKAGHEYRTGYKGNTKAMSSGVKDATYRYKGVPVPLITAAREFGSSRGEAKKPFVRPAFSNTVAIERAMQAAQDRYLREWGLT